MALAHNLHRRRSDAAMAQGRGLLQQDAHAHDREPFEDPRGHRFHERFNEHILLFAGERLQQIENLRVVDCRCV